MRLWTVHPRYLDARGIVALWREALLAKAVLLGRTRGYRHHPQLERFKTARDPVASVNAYLAGILDEAIRRGYAFDASKARGRRARARMTETRGQLRHEWAHLLRKLRGRDRKAWARAIAVKRPKPHPLFTLVSGGVRSWERAPLRSFMAAAPRSAGIQGALKKIALRHAGVEEDVACKGTPIESAAYKVRKKSFLFVGAGKARLKLESSLGEAKKLAKANPGACDVGKLGWVAVSLGPDAPPPSVLERWISESYALAAPAGAKTTAGRSRH